MTKLTIRDLLNLYQNNEKIVSLSLYDAMMAKLADESGAHLILVGDSMAMTILGHKNTVMVTLEQSLHHTAAVVRGVRRALVVGDMPFLTYQINSDEALRNAGRYLQEAGADAVKLEGGKTMAQTVQRLVDSGIPVVGHIGILPQKIMLEGSYRIQGKNAAQNQELIEDAKSLQDAGAFAIILEGITASTSQSITESLSIPTIGIGAGLTCSGQIQVVNDILGLNDGWTPKHSKQYGELATMIKSIFSRYGDEVRSGQFPGSENIFI